MKIALKSSLLAAFVVLMMFVSTCYADTRPQVFSQYGFSAVLPPTLKRNYAGAPEKGKDSQGNPTFTVLFLTEAEQDAYGVEVISYVNPVNASYDGLATFCVSTLEGTAKAPFTLDGQPAVFCDSASQHDDGSTVKIQNVISSKGKRLFILMFIDTSKGAGQSDSARFFKEFRMFDKPAPQVFTGFGFSAITPTPLYNGDDPEKSNDSKGNPVTRSNFGSSRRSGSWDYYGVDVTTYAKPLNLTADELRVAAKDWAESNGRLVMGSSYVLDGQPAVAFRIAYKLADGTDTFEHKVITSKGNRLFVLRYTTRDQDGDMKTTSEHEQDMKLFLNEFKMLEGK
jgi:hypothetical protein